MRWAIIGASNVADQHVIPAIKSIDSCIIKGVFSNTSLRADYICQRHGIEKKYDQLISVFSDTEIDAVYVSNKNNEHALCIELAIKYNKNILCDKPIGLTSEVLGVLKRKIESSNIIFATNHHLRAAGSHNVIKNMIQSGVIGEVLSIHIQHSVLLPENLRTWRIDDPIEYGGGVISDISVHDADLVKFYLGKTFDKVIGTVDKQRESPTRVSPTRVSWIGRLIDSETLISATEDFNAVNAPIGISIIGNKGSIVGVNILSQLPLGSIFLNKGNGSIEVPFEKHDLYSAAIKKFSESVMNKNKPMADFYDGAHSAEVAIALHKSLISEKFEKVVRY